MRIRKKPLEQAHVLCSEGIAQLLAASERGQ
jgi:hypothetical protein